MHSQRYSFGLFAAAILVSIPTLHANANADADAGDFDGNGRDDLVIKASIESLDSVESAGALHVIYGRNSGLKATGDQFWHQDVPGIQSTADDHEYFGWNAAAGDFNGDGRSDLAISVYGETVNGNSNAGAVHVLYGRSGGLSATGDQFWTRATPGVQGDPQIDETFGHALAVGDFDGDGFDDLAIGNPYHDSETHFKSGEVLILYGSSSGLTAAGDQLFSQATPGIAGEPNNGEFFGWSLAAGDFDGDGRDDLAIGTLYDEIDGISGGAVHVLFGRSSGLSAVGDQHFHQDTPGIADKVEEDDGFAWALAAGDFDGDGRDDLAIGVAYEEIDGANDAGAVHVLYGSNAGLSASGDQYFHQNTPGIPNKCHAGDTFGAAIAAGDFNGDGRDDLAIGVPGEGIDGIAWAGAVHVLFGRNAGLRVTGDQFIHQNTPGVVGSCSAFDNFGADFLVGDFNGDGRDDLAVTAWYDSINGIQYAGSVTVFYGSNNGPSLSGEQFWHQNTAGIADGNESSDYVGYCSPGES